MQKQNLHDRNQEFDNACFAITAAFERQNSLANNRIIQHRNQSNSAHVWSLFPITGLTLSIIHNITSQIVSHAGHQIRSTPTAFAYFDSQK